MPDCGEGRFNRIAGADALPVRGREVEECHEFAAVFLQAQRSLGVFGFVGFDEQIEGLFGIVFGLGLPDVVQGGFGFWLRKIGQAIQHIHRLVHPTPLLACLGAYFFQRSPEPHSTVADCQFGRIHSTLFEFEKDFAPALGGLAHPILNGQELLLPMGIYANDKFSRNSGAACACISDATCLTTL